VEKIVGDKAVPGDYWKTATIAEAMLIKKEYAAAADMYQKAIDISPTEKKSHESTAKQAKLLLQKLGANADTQGKVLKAFS
jgi:carboxylesterase type B